MSTKPRIIAAGVQAEQSQQLREPSDDSTTVYRSPSDDDSAKTKTIAPTPPTTAYNGGNAGKSSANTSKSS